MVPHLGGCGAERVLACVAAGVDREQFEVHLAVVADDEPGAAKLPEWVTVHRLQTRRVRWAAARAVLLVWHLRPELVVPGMMHLNALMLTLKPLLPSGTRIAPRVNTTVSRVFTRRTERWVYAWLMRRADAVICQSEAMAEEMSTNLGVAREKTLVVENPVDVESIRAVANAARHTRQRERDAVHLLYVGRLAHEKGVDILLKAWTHLAARDTRIRLTIVGDGAERNRLEALCVQQGLSETVEFAGFQQNVAHWLGWADVLVQPSRREGLPNALLEAAAAGLALVTTPSSEGVVRLLQDRPGVWVAHESDSASLAVAVEAATRAVRERRNLEDERYEHLFLEPFAMRTALRRWENCLTEALRISILERTW